MIKAMQDRAVLLILLITAGIAFAAPHSSTRDILKRNIFADPPPPSPRLTAPILRQEPVLPLEKVLLVKGIIFTPSGESRAIIERIEKKQEELLEIGDIIENSRITRINATSVFFERDGRSVELLLTRESIPLQDVPLAGTQVAVPRKVPFSPSARSILKNPVMPASSDTVDSQSPQEPLPPVELDFDEALQSLKSDLGLLASLNITPYMQDGKVNGFIVNNIPSNSLPSQLGIRNGDVVQRVNGVLIDSVNRGYQLFSTLSSSKTSSVTVEILRSGNPLTLTYRNVK